jgi:hypothetical protein
MSSRIMAIGISLGQVNWNRFCVECHNGDKHSSERRGYNDRISDNGWPIDKQRHPFYVKRF